MNQAGERPSVNLIRQPSENCQPFSGNVSGLAENVKSVSQLTVLNVKSVNKLTEFTNMTLIPRNLAPIVDKATPPKAVAIFGPRRIGKTTMLEKLVGTGVARWYNGDAFGVAEALRFQSPEDAKNALLQAPAIVIDEAHKIPDIGNIVKMLVDVNEHLEKPAKIFVTSSSPFYLASLKESALGRVTSRQMWPLSVSEIAAFTSWGKVLEAIEHHLVYGLMPTVYTAPEEARGFLTDFCDGLLLQDIFEQGTVRHPKKLRRLVQVLAQKVGSEVTSESLGRECGISKNTVDDYIAKLEQASIVRVCRSYSRNLANELKKGKKIYFFDNGVRNAILQRFTPLAERSDAGALWENFFFMERVKLHDTRRDFTQMYFWRTTGSGAAEVDFIEELDGSIRAFECKVSKAIKSTRGAKKFLATYPNAQLEIVSPEDCMRLFSESK